jgi:hypothetical protein
LNEISRSSGKEIRRILFELEVSLPSSKQPTSVPSTDSTANIHTISANLSNNHFKVITHVYSGLQAPLRLTYSDQKSLCKNPKTFISFTDPCSLQSSHLLKRHYRNNDKSKRLVSGFGGLGVSVLASGTQVRGFKPSDF